MPPPTPPLFSKYQNWFRTSKGKTRVRFTVPISSPHKMSVREHSRSCDLYNFDFGLKVYLSVRTLALREQDSGVTLTLQT